MEVVADAFDLFEEVEEISGDGEVGDRVGDAAVFYPVSQGPVGEIAGDGGGGGAVYFIDEEALFDAGQKFLGGREGALPGNIGGRDAKGAANPAGGIAGRFGAGLSGGVAVVEEVFQEAGGNQLFWMARGALRIPVMRGEAGVALIGDGNDGACHPLSPFARQFCQTTIEQVPTEDRAEGGQEMAGGMFVKQDRPITLRGRARFRASHGFFGDLPDQMIEVKVFFVQRGETLSGIDDPLIGADRHDGEIGAEPDCFFQALIAYRVGEQSGDGGKTALDPWDVADLWRKDLRLRLELQPPIFELVQSQGEDGVIGTDRW